MGVNITIEGSVTPASGVLKRGQRQTLQLTDRVQGWLNRGYVVEISREEFPDVAPEPAKVSPEPESGVEQSGKFYLESTPHDEPKQLRPPRSVKKVSGGE